MEYDDEWIFRLQRAKLKGHTSLFDYFKPDKEPYLTFYNEIIAGTVIELLPELNKILADGYSAWRFNGESMQSYGIYKGDIVIAEDNDLRRDSYDSLVIVEMENEVYLRHYDGTYLCADDPYPNIMTTYKELNQIAIPIFTLNSINDIFYLDEKQRISRYFEAAKKPKYLSSDNHIL